MGDQVSHIPDHYNIAATGRISQPQESSNSSRSVEDHEHTFAEASRSASRNENRAEQKKAYQNILGMRQIYAQNYTVIVGPILIGIGPTLFTSKWRKQMNIRPKEMGLQGRHVHIVLSSAQKVGIVSSK